MADVLTLSSGRPLRGACDVPGDKSLTHRALLLAALADGPSRIRGYLAGGDCLATVGCLRALGVEIDTPAEGEIVARGLGLRGLCEPDDALDCVRSGTTMRLLAGLLAGQAFYSILRAEAQLRKRPMDRVIQPLRLMGAQINGRAGDRLPPLTIVGRPLRGAEYTMPVASAQVKSCLLLAGLYAEGATTVIEPTLSRDHTERMLRARGVKVHTQGARHTIVGPCADLAALDTAIPGDFSSAAFFLAAGLIVPGSAIVVRDVGVNPTRTGLLDALRAMGGEIELANQRDAGGEPTADLVVGYSALRGVELGGEIVPRMIDEFPILALAATQAHGVTRVRDAAELRVKETDRIAVVVDALRRLGARIEPTPDGFIIEGPTPLVGAPVESCGDHRLAMMLAIAGLVARGETAVHGMACVADSFPGFQARLSRLKGIKN